MSNLGEIDINKIALEEIVITNASIGNPDNLSELQPGHSFDISFGFNSGINRKASKARIIFNCQLQAEDVNKKPLPVNGKFDISYIFKVENLEELIIEREGKFDVNMDLILALTNIAYSTSRGVIFTRSQGTILNQVILPILPNQKLHDLLQPNL